MKSLSKEQKATRDKLALRLTECRDKITDALDEYNDAIVTAYAEVEKVVAEYNAAIGDANGFINDVHAELSDYADNKSDKWAESPAGEAFVEWMEGWDTELDECELNGPEEIDEPDIVNGDALHELQEDFAGE